MQRSRPTNNSAHPARNADASQKALADDDRLGNGEIWAYLTACVAGYAIGAVLFLSKGESLHGALAGIAGIVAILFALTEAEKPIGDNQWVRRARTGLACATGGAAVATALGHHANPCVLGVIGAIPVGVYMLLREFVLHRGTINPKETHPEPARRAQRRQTKD